MATHSLYRFYDAQGELLYVGSTAHLPSRMGQHNAAKPWWSEVASTQVEHFATREESRAAEQDAIDIESPRWNVNRVEGKTPLRTFRIADGLYQAAQARAAEKGETVSEAVRKFLERYVR